MEDFNIEKYWQQVDDVIDGFPNANVAHYEPIEYDAYGQLARGSKQIVYVDSKESAEKLKELLLQIPNRRALKVKIATVGDGVVVLSKTPAAHSRRLTAEQVLKLIAKDIKNADNLGALGKKLIKSLKSLRKVMQDFANKNGANAPCIVRSRSGYAHRVQYFDGLLGKRKQINIGDVLIFVLLDGVGGVTVSTPPRRSVRTDRIAMLDDVEIVRWGRSTSIYDAKKVDEQAYQKALAKAWERGAKPARKKPQIATEVAPKTKTQTVTEKPKADSELKKAQKRFLKILKETGDYGYTSDTPESVAEMTMEELLNSADCQRDNHANCGGDDKSEEYEYKAMKKYERFIARFKTNP
ncbi:hypothetical protein [Selenomonas sp. AE3005]|uniref:hypothetical protein n=1 Tax=Selenomonas sp. AE3005 TaxID=1485543 RepID=UPI000486C157|nr:hypothetical protein [Selenomonas sp. AE3005]